MKIFFFAVLIAFISLVVILFIASFFIFRIAAKREDHDLKADERFIEKYGLSSKKEEIKNSLEKWNAATCEEVSMTSFDGTRLYGTYAPAENARATVILFHGWRSSGERDFSCILGMYIDRGFNILLVCERAHGKSEGKHLTFGVNESRDAVCWANFIESHEKGKYPIFLEGLSMGATTVLMASGRELPSSVKGIIADCGFTSPKEIISHVISGYHLPTKPFLPFISFWFRVLAKTDINYSSVDAMKKSHLPVLIIHGDADDFVPCEMSQRNFEACVSEKNILIVPGAGHGGSYVKDSKSCLDAIDAFYARFGL